MKNWREVAKKIDHTLLSMNATKSDVLKLCREAIENEFYAVCVNPFHVKTAAEAVKNTGVKVASVIDFPLGQSFTEIRVKEGILCVKKGADELDIVSNLSLVKEGKMNRFRMDLEDIIGRAREKKRDLVVKVIVEVGYLTKEEIKETSLIAAEAGADLIKTCTGKGPRGVMIEDVKFLKKILPGDIGIKASGGIRNLDFTLKLIDAGAMRIGSSAAISIIKEARRKMPD